MNADNFDPERLVVLGELPEAEKDKFFRFLISTGAHFYEDESGGFLADVRVVAPCAPPAAPAAATTSPPPLSPAKHFARRLSHHSPLLSAGSKKTQGKRSIKNEVHNSISQYFYQSNLCQQCHNSKNS
mmetsp:Transcript_42084/g.69530  ORF Transcript_42084/g.69530 Transcript_42084/m.69530 type:complete len:128 (+) Transcript_42084:53-436(+)